ncbi:sodium-dependent nutrient amino acid transporter 1-like [Lycorma delicatula]|uniref:sodium-dependent nutrient amino acid transporter 1-like n=1 Tax=Lycorma delicatula TaxID=130591 RepID=UPI003F513E1D
MIAIGLLQTVYEIAVASDTLNYLRESFSSSLPWMICKPEWGKQPCFGEKDMHHICGSNKHTDFKGTWDLSAWKYRVLDLRVANVHTNNKKETDSKDHFSKNILPRRVLSLFFTCVIVLIISDLNFSPNNKTSEFVYIFLLIFMFILTFVIVIHLNNSALMFNLFMIKTESLFNYDSWVDTVLYFVKAISISDPCTVLIGSYFPRASMTDLQAFVTWMGLMTLYTLGELMTAAVHDVLVEQLCLKPDALDSLGFEDITSVLYPQFLGSITFSPQTFCFIYFMLMFTSSMMRIKLQLAAIYNSMADGKPIIRLYRFYIRIFSCCLLFILAFPFCVVNVYKEALLFLRFLQDCLGITVLGITTVGILYIYGTQTLCDDHHFIYGSQPAIFFKITLLVTPAVFFTVGAFLFLRMSNLYETHPHIAYYLYAAFPICLCLHFVGLLYITTYYLKRQNMAHLLKCEDTWGDPNSNMRKERIIYHPRKETNYFRRIDACKHECLRYSRLNPTIYKDEKVLQSEGFRLLKPEEKLFSNKEAGVID